MRNYEEFITSGILELYVLGYTSVEEEEEVEEMKMLYPQVQEEIISIGLAMENHALANGIAPDPTIRPFLMATIDLTERMKGGEILNDVPILSESSKMADYAQWINREDMVLDEEGFDDIYAKIIGYTAEAISAIVWIKEMAPDETHTKEYERFLILEGTCDITVGMDVYSLKKGDYFQIPLFKNHVVTVTSVLPCKVILQRVAA